MARPSIATTASASTRAPRSIRPPRRRSFAARRSAATTREPRSSCSTPASSRSSRRARSSRSHPSTPGEAAFGAKRDAQMADVAGPDAFERAVIANERSKPVIVVDDRFRLDPNTGFEPTPVTGDQHPRHRMAAGRHRPRHRRPADDRALPGAQGHAAAPAGSLIGVALDPSRTAAALGGGRSRCVAAAGVRARHICETAGSNPRGLPVSTAAPAS